MSLKEYVAQEMETLGEEELQAVAEYVSFLKFRSRADLLAQWEQEDAQMTPEQQADNARIYAEIECEGIPRVRFWRKAFDSHKNARCKYLLHVATKNKQNMTNFRALMILLKGATVAMMSIGLGSCASQAQTQDAKAETRHSLKVLTYNIHRANPPAQKDVIDLAGIARVIRNSDADLVALQEVDVRTERSGKEIDQAQELGRLTERKVFFAKGIDFQGGEYGIAILSKLPFLQTESMALPMQEGAGGEPRVLAWVTVEPVKGQKLVFANTHLDLKPENRALQVRAIAGKLGELATPVVLCGDFNAIPDSDDIAFLDRKFQRSEINFGFTIPAAFPLKEIDYVMFRPAAKFQVRKHEVVDERRASDHRPVLVELIF